MTSPKVEQLDLATEDDKGKRSLTPNGNEVDR
jgi:hypothetical protein